MRLAFWDIGERTAERFLALRDACVADADAVLYVFSLADRGSFDGLPSLVQRTIIAARRPLPGLVVGTQYPLLHRQFAWRPALRHRHSCVVLNPVLHCRPAHAVARQRG